MLSLKDQKRIIWSMLLLLFVFLLTACGGGDNGGSSESSARGNSTVPDACELLSAADVGTVLGDSVSAIGNVDEEGFFSTCTWLDETSGARLALNIWGAGNAGDEWATEFLAAQSGADFNVAVENLGDEAYANIDGDNSSYVWRIDDAFVVVFTSAANEASEDSLLELARKIANGF